MPGLEPDPDERRFREAEEERARCEREAAPHREEAARLRAEIEKAADRKIDERRAFDERLRAAIEDHRPALERLARGPGDPRDAECSAT
jgi:hypothetical protein